MTSAARYHEDHCQRCHVRRTREIWPDGRYLVLLASSCPTKDFCEREMLVGFKITTDAEIADPKR